jgi:adenylate cyclase class 2
MNPRVPLETEIKLRIPSCEALAPMLAALGFRETQPAQEEISELWDRGGELLRQRSALRLRTFAGAARLTWKGPVVADPLLKIRPELETGIESREVMEGILRALGFEPVLRMVKTRGVWERAELVACLDRTPFGDFLELEGEPLAIRLAMEGLSLNASHLEPRSYPALWREAGH